jgi:diguanylate cyclase (GGDEF) domain
VIKLTAPRQDPLRETARVVVPFLLIVAAVLASASLAFYKYLETETVESLGRQAETMASVTAKLVEMNLGDYRQLKTEADAQRSFYVEMKELFRKMKSSDFIRFVYTERRIAEAKIIYVLDSEEEGSPEASPIGQEDDLDELGRKVFDTGKSAHGGLVSDPRWGVFITGYAPIIDQASGGVEGIAGVDVAARTVNAMLRSSRLVILVAACAIFALAILPLARLGHALARQLRLDPLTGTCAKKALRPDLERAVERARSSNLSLAVLVLDLDRFKLVNDSHGHEAGDLVLAAASRAMASALRSGDILYRYGGEEFALIMLGPPESRAMAVAELMRERVGAARVQAPGCGELSVTVSVGVAMLGPGEEEDSLLGRADAAMYESKQKGRNRVSLAAPASAVTGCP